MIKCGKMLRKVIDTLRGVILKIWVDYSSYTAAQKSSIITVTLVIVGVISQSWALLLWFFASLPLSIPLFKWLFNRHKLFKSDFLPGLWKQIKHNLIFIKSVLNKESETVPAINPKKYSLFLQQEINTFTKYIERDFIESWYFDVIEGSQNWSRESHKLIYSLFAQVQQRLSRVNRFRAIETFIKLYRQFVADYQEAQSNIKQQPRYRKKKGADTEFKKIKTTQQAFESLGKFHVALQDEESELEYLRSLTEVVVQILLPEQLMDCVGGRIILQEILMKNILHKLVMMMSEPEWLHQVMVKILSDEELEIVNVTNKSGDEKVNKPEVQIHADRAEQSSSSSGLVPSALPTVTSGTNQGDKDTGSSHDPTGVQKSYTTDNLAILFRVESNMELTSTEAPRVVEIPVTVHEGRVDSLQRRRMSASPPNDSIALTLAPHGGNLSRSSSLNILSTSPTTSLVSASGSSPTASVSVSSLSQRNLSRCQRSQDGADGASVSSFPSIGETQSEAGTDLEWKESPALYVSDAVSDVDEFEKTLKPEQFAEAADLTADSLTGTSPYDEEDVDVPLGCDVVAELESDPEFIFEMIVVPSFEVAKEAGGTGYYTLYIIQYDAWHKDDEDNWGLKTTVLKRRFREFLTLNERLQEHSIYKAFMKGVKGPHRMLHMPLGVKDKNMIEKRRKFLQVYMKTLIRQEQVCQSIPLKEFLAYEGDASIAFVKKVSDVNRFDKVLVRTVSGVVDKIGKVFPSLPDENLVNKKYITSEKKYKKRRRKVTLTSQDGAVVVDPDVMEILFDIPQFDEENHFDSSMDDYVRENVDDISSNSRKDNTNAGKSNSEEFFDPVDFNLLSGVPRSSGDGCEMTQSGENNASGDLSLGISLTSAVLDLAVQLAQGRQSWVCQQHAIRLLKLVLGKAIESFIIEEVTDLTSEKRWAFYVNQLCEAIWPGGHLDEEETAESSQEQKQVTCAQARRCLVDFFPDGIPIIVGQPDFQHCVDITMESIEHPKLNRHFMFCVLDLLVELTIPEVSTADLHNRLLLRYTQQ